MKITVFGSGAWGIANAILLHNNGHDVALRSSHDGVTRMLSTTRANPHLKDILIPDGIRIAETFAAATADTEIAVIATSSPALREIAQKLAEALAPECVVVCVSKGIERNSAMLFSQILREVFGEERKIAILSGPAHAEEVARRMPTAVVAASHDKRTAELVQDVWMNDEFRVYTTDDVVGVELGAALKNVIAIGAGVSEGLGFGDNTIAMLATRGLTEIAHLVLALGGRRETITGLAGLGDLMVTCTSRHSRNRRAGVLIGKGATVEDAMSEVGAIVEGYHAAHAAYTLAVRHGVDMPICTETYYVLYEGKDPKQAMRDLMSRTKRSETELSFI